MTTLPSSSCVSCPRRLRRFDRTYSVYPFRAAIYPRTALRVPAGLDETSFTGGAGAFDFLESRKFCQNTRIGLAMKIDEYVPTIIPTTRAKAKLFSTCPPNRNSDRAVNNVNPLVRIVLLNVLLTLM